MAHTKEFIEENYGLTDEQMKATKAVYRAIRKAGKLGVEFWDNYGTLTAFNAKKMTLPVPSSFSLSNDTGCEYSTHDIDLTYWEQLSNFYAGNADDELWFNLID